MPSNYLSPNSKNELTLRPSKRKHILIALGCALFTAGGVSMLGQPDSTGWMVTIFFGLCMIVSIVNLIPNATYLRLMDSGFEQCVLFRASRTSWSDVQDFREVEVSDKRLVGFDFSDNYKKSGKMRKVNSFLAGAEGTLVDTFGMKPQELVDLMEEWKARSSS